MRKHLRVKTGIIQVNPELYEMTYYDGCVLISSVEIFRGLVYIYDRWGSGYAAMAATFSSSIRKVR